jgi:hypothetical protein
MPSIDYSGGVLTLNGSVAAFQPKIATGLTAHAGGGQSSALVLTAAVNFVTTVATDADSVKLTANVHQVVFNQGTHALSIYPPSGGAIDALGTNNAYSLAAGASRAFYPQTSTTWASR